MDASSHGNKRGMQRHPRQCRPRLHAQHHRRPPPLRLPLRAHRRAPRLLRHVCRWGQLPRLRVQRLSQRHRPRRRALLHGHRLTRCRHQKSGCALTLPRAYAGCPPVSPSTGGARLLPSTAGSGGVMPAAFKLFDGMSSPQEEKPVMWHNVSIPACSVHGVVCGSLVVASRHCENPTSLETSISTTSRMHIKCLLICPKTSTYNNTGSDLLDAGVFYCGKTPKGKNIILVIAWTKFFSCAYWCVQLKADIGKLQAHDNTCWLEVMIAERISGWVNEFHWLGSKCCNTSLDCPMFISLEVMENSLVILPIQTNENDQEAVWSGTSVLKIMPLPSWVKLEVESIQLQQPWPPPRQSCKQQFQGNNGYALVACFNKFQNASEEINKCRRRFIQGDDGLDTTQPLESGSLKATYGHRGLIGVIFVEGSLHNTLTFRPGGGSNQMVTLNMLASEVCVPVKFETDTAECDQTRLSVGQFIYKAAIFPLVSSTSLIQTLHRLITARATTLTTKGTDEFLDKASNEKPDSVSYRRLHLVPEPLLFSLSLPNSMLFPA